MSITDIIDAAADAGIREGAESKTVEVNLADWEVSGDAVLPYNPTVTDMARAAEAARARVGAQFARVDVYMTQKKATVTFIY